MIYMDKRARIDAVTAINVHKTTRADVVLVIDVNKSTRTDIVLRRHKTFVGSRRRIRLLSECLLVGISNPAWIHLGTNKQNLAQI